MPLRGMFFSSVAYMVRLFLADCFPVSPCACGGGSRGVNPVTPNEKSFTIIRRTLRFARSFHHSQPFPLSLLCLRYHARIQRSFSLRLVRWGGCLVLFRGFPCQLFILTPTPNENKYRKRAMGFRLAKRKPCQVAPRSIGQVFTN